ncbi:hypothetical protein EZV61_16605 [Corallincola luteus]|uniref:Baseplate protein J-like domain-containing protein n=1 Tax=Corallincola luteus TaxID=1775177 RepID=A0ABY2AH25_9GAMM|nr:baseplate J/gp47 family protein [Corallincola luteus]TCI01885.1 hypothetical protein EZV61_16605 [Corallincola luteus]
MTDSCKRDNPLHRRGSDQQSRQLAALSPDHFKVDERTLADFLLFARRYSEQIRFYGPGANASSDWKPFFQQDVSVVLAGLSQLPYRQYLTFSQALKTFLASDPNADSSVLNQYFLLQIHLPLLLLAEVNDSLKLLPQDHPLVFQSDAWVKRHLSSPLTSLMEYYKGALAAPLQGFSDQPLDTNLLNLGSDPLSPYLLLPGSVASRLTPLTWPSLWQQRCADLADLAAIDYASIAAVTNPYLQASGTFEQIQDALNYNLLVNSVESIITAMAVIVEQANAALSQSLLQGDHAPHYGLWLAFVKLYQEPQKILNRFTGRHLDYYYRDILQIPPQPAVPAKVAVVLTPAKQVKSHLLAKGSLLDAGKSPSGQPLQFALQSDFVVNRATVKELRGFRRVVTDNGEIPYTSSVANSADGQGQALPKSDPSWPAFGPANDSNQAELGFVVADRQLLLSDGQRFIRLIAQLSAPASASWALAFKAAITTEKAWLDLDSTQLSVQRIGDDLEFVIRLEGSVPAITCYNPKVHGSGYKQGTPALRIWIDPDSGQFANLIDLKFSHLLLDVAVIGSRHYSLSGDHGVLDPSKPFMPFGPQPKPGSQLILGGKELFGKPLQLLVLRASWQESFGYQSHFKAHITALNAHCHVSTLAQGGWQPIPVAAEVPFFVNAADQFDIHAYLQLVNSSGHASEDESSFALLSQLDYLTRLAFAPYLKGIWLDNLDTVADLNSDGDSYQTSSISGFVKFTLGSNFGHHQFAAENSLALIGKTVTSPAFTQKSYYSYDSAIPKPPYTPVMTELLVDYLSVAATQTEFYHHDLFGVRQIDLAATSTVEHRLFPEHKQAGELYLGIADLQPPQSLSLLFHAQEGSANPLKELATLQWDYLVGDQWQPFDNPKPIDGSYSLSGSGIITLVIPEAADTQHAILPSGLHWLRLSVTEDVDALCRLIEVLPQATTAYQSSALDEVATLPAGTISKLVLSDSGIKAVNQPLASFGGSAAEPDSGYALRISERLRHKQRAVSPWDYEQLVLAQFPEVFRVRCLNHSALCESASQPIVNGRKPGSVLVVPIPQMIDGHFQAPNRPYNTRQTLAKIAEYLRSRISPFVQLRVENPQVEEIKLQLNVAFKPEILDTDFYIEQLKQEVDRHLMPWAYGDGAQLDFAGSWHKSMLINFIEQQAYVDYVTDVLMFHRVDINDSDPSWLSRDLDLITASSARSVLVSHLNHNFSIAGCA